MRPLVKISIVTITIIIIIATVTLITVTTAKITANHSHHKKNERMKEELKEGRNNERPKKK